MLENRWGFDENSLVQEGRRQKAGGRRQKAGGRRQKAEGKKAYTVSFFTFVNWIVISATLH
jgi:hypothetical protein